MPTLQIDFDEEENQIIEEFKHKYKINNKKEALRKMVRELNEMGKENENK